MYPGYGSHYNTNINPYNTTFPPQSPGFHPPTTPNYGPQYGAGNNNPYSTSVPPPMNPTATSVPPPMNPYSTNINYNATYPSNTYDVPSTNNYSSGPFGSGSGLSVPSMQGQANTYGQGNLEFGYGSNSSGLSTPSIPTTPVHYGSNPVPSSVPLPQPSNNVYATTPAHGAFGDFGRTPSSQKILPKPTTPDALISAVAAEKFNADKMTIIRNSTAVIYSFTSNDVKRLISNLEYVQDQKEILISIYPKVTDKENFDSTISIMKYSMDQEDVREKLGITNQAAPVSNAPPPNTHYQQFASNSSNPSGPSYYVTTTTSAPSNTAATSHPHLATAPLHPHSAIAPSHPQPVTVSSHPQPPLAPNPQPSGPNPPQQPSGERLTMGKDQMEILRQALKKMEEEKARVEEEKQKLEKQNSKLAKDVENFSKKVNETVQVHNRKIEDLDKENQNLYDNLVATDREMAEKDNMIQMLMDKLKVLTGKSEINLDEPIEDQYYDSNMLNKKLLDLVNDYDSMGEEPSERKSQTEEALLSILGGMSLEDLLK